MAKPSGSIRTLYYPLDRTLDLQSTTSSEGVSFVDLTGWSTPDPDERIDIVLNISLNEYVALASAIDAGRDLAYGDESIYIWFLWVRSLVSMDLCQGIANCINDPNSPANLAVTDLVRSQDSENALEYAQDQALKPFASDHNPTCDLDRHWGGIVALVTSADTNNSDALQILEVLTNALEWLQQAMGSLQGKTAQALATAQAWAVFIQNSILENYEAQITQEYLETIQCDLFCLTKDDCGINPQVLVDYFFGRLESQLTYESLFEDSLNFIFTGVWSGTEIADAMFLSQFVFRAQLGKWFDQVSFNPIFLDFQLGLNNPDSDWQLLCNCDDNILITFDVLSDTGWVISEYFESPYVPLVAQVMQDNTRGNPIPACKGAFVDNTGDTTEGCFAGNRVDFTEDRTVTSINLDFYWLRTIPANDVFVVLLRFYDEFNVQLHSIQSNNNGDPNNEWRSYATGSINVSDVRWVSISVFRTDGASTSVNSQVWVDNIQISFGA